MADRGLTLDQFWALSEEERRRRYEALSDHDKFLVRVSMPPGPAVFIPCNVCMHRVKGKAVCKAFPEGLNGDQIRAVIKDPSAPCGGGYRFEEGPDDAT